MSEEKLVPKLRFSGFNDEWKEVKLNEISTINPKTKSLPENFIYIDLDSVEKGILTKINKINIKDAPSRAQRLLDVGDILFQTVRPYQMNNLYFNYNNEKYVASTGYAQIKSKINSKFLYYHLHHDQFVNEVLRRCTGTSYPAINSNDLKKIKIRIPVDSNEQQFIGNIFVKIDEKIELLQKKHNHYLNFKKHLMQQIFAQKLRFAEFDDEWMPYKIGDISKTYSGGTPSTSKKEYYEGNIPFIKSGEINNEVTEQYITEDAINNSSAKRVQKGDLLLALYGATSGEVAISKINGAINQAVLKIDNNMDNYFQYCYFSMYKDQIVHKYIQGGQGNLSANIIKKLVFKYPSLAEQKKISQFFMSFDNKLKLYENKIIKYNNFKKGLLQQMFI